MKLLSIEGNLQRLDGGAMYGNAPRELWQRWSPPDDLNRIRLATRALFLETDDGRRFLFETGAGAFFAPKLQRRFGIEPAHHLLLENLDAAGIDPASIDAVILSHLHFDHAGGLVTAYSEDEPYRLVFPRARFYVGKAQWQRARAPHVRDRVSYIPPILDLLEQSGRLVLIDTEQVADLSPLITFHFSDGHTPGMMMSCINLSQGPLVFVADLMPGAPWVRDAITMGYDRYPELLVDEKRHILETVAARRGFLFFTHDPQMAVGRVVRDEKGAFTVQETVLANLARM